MPHWIKSNGPLLVGIFLIIILPIFESKFPSAFQYIENWLSLSASLITILALFLAFWQWKKQLIANKKDNLSSKLINLLIRIEKDIRLLRSPLQEFPNYEKKSEQHAWRFKSLFSPILTKQSDIEALLIEFSLVCGNELEETYNKGLKIEINKLYLSYIELIENQIDFEDRRITEEDFSSREKELAGILWPLRKEKDETGLKIAKQIKDMISILTPNLIR